MKHMYEHQNQLHESLISYI